MSEKTCPNSNGNAAFVHGLSDAMDDGFDTFAEFSKCKCNACAQMYEHGYRAGVSELRSRNNGGGCDFVEMLMARISELESQVAALEYDSKLLPPPKKHSVYVHGCGLVEFVTKDDKAATE